jgi:hypothetical protein
MKLKTTALVLAIAALASTAHAQAQFKGNDPFKPVVGKWMTRDGTFTSTTNSSEYADRNTSWTGKMWGVIKPSGQILFKAENGCVLSGMAAPFASNGLWAINGKLEACKIGHFNQRVFGNMRREGNEVILDVGDMPFVVGRPPVGYYIKLKMVAY